MISSVNAIYFIEELLHNNNAPMKFLCDDDEVYFLKYLTVSEDEFDDLCYEVVCNRLAKHFGIQTPDIAYVTPREGSFTKDKLIRNQAFFEPGIIAFGSKNIGTNDTLDNTGRFSLQTKPNFNRYLNPTDLVKVAIFDVHIHNQDRNEDNYNLLVKNGEKLDEFYAIDHVNVFGGAIARGNLNPSQVNLSHKFLTSSYFRTLIKYYSLTDLKNELQDYLYLCRDIPEIIDETFTTIPTEWSYSDDLPKKIVTFLNNETRNEAMRVEVEEYLDYIKSI